MSSKEELFAHLDEHGYVVLKGVLTVNQIGALRERSYATNLATEAPWRETV